MVQHYLWKQFGVGRGDLCIGCLEKRIGRPLNSADFTPFPINNPYHPWKTPRLVEAMRRLPAGSQPRRVRTVRLAQHRRVAR